MFSYIFRVDAGNIPELGTGHIYRSIEIYKYLLKKGIKKDKILFIVKSLNKYSKCKKILLKNKIKFQSIGTNILDFSVEELNFLNKFKSRVIIFDRMSEINRKFIKSLKENHNKIVGIDIKKKKNVKIDYFINPLNNKFNNKKKLLNFKNNILPSYNYKKNKKKNYKINKIKKIFVFFGGYDFKKLEKKIKKIKISNTKYIFSKKNFYSKMSTSDIVLCSGGLIAFDAIYKNKITICIPQYEHQLKNLKVLNKQGIISLIKKNTFNGLKSTILNSVNLSKKEKNLIFKKQNKIISWHSQKKVLNNIYKLHA